MGDEQQQDPLRRLFQDLEQRVGARPVEFVDGINDGDAPSPLPGGRAEERDRAAHVVDRDLLAQHAFVVERAFENEQVALRLRRDAARDRMLRRRRPAKSPP